MSPVMVLSTESVDRRVLGGFVVADAITGASVNQAISVNAEQLTLQRNRSGVYAIFDAPGFTPLTSEFLPTAAAWPASRNFEVTVQDPTLRYLPRRATLQAPQPLTSLSTPQIVTLYPGPSGIVAPNWALVRATVTGNAGTGLPWVFLRVIRSDSTIAATGMTDSRGEGLLAVPGLGVQVSSVSGTVTETTIPVTVQAWFDRTVLTRPAGWTPNPDDMAAALATLQTATITGALGATQILFAKITISV